MMIRTEDHLLKNTIPARRTAKGWRIGLTTLLCMLLPLLALARKEDADDEEISISLEIRNVGMIDIPAIYHGKDLYLPVTTVFDFIKVKNRPSPAYDSITGFYLNEGDLFVIDENHNRITYGGKVYNVDPADLIRSETGLYMNLKYYKTVFGLNGTFNFRMLLVSFTTDLELPIMREARLDMMRKNVSRLRGEQKADTAIKRSYPFFHLGNADWGVMSTQQSQGIDDTRLNLGLGGMVAGGETNVSLNYYSRQPFSELQQYYQWKYVNNDLAALRQVVAGKIFTQSVASLYAPVVGIQVSNAPTTYRQSYGTYTLSDKTDPGWIVELYVNDVLIDYAKADASGFYTFEVPLIYGYTTIKLRFYGPYGEERTTKQYVSVPFSLLPNHEFEYTASGGIVEDGQNSKYSRVSMGYGVSKNITIGGGMEYLSSVTSGNMMPFVNTSVRLMKRLLLSGEYNHGVRSRGLLSYRMPTGLQVDIDYIKYAPGQTAIYYNYLEEHKAIVSVPIRSKNFNFFGRFTVDDITVPLSHYTNTELAFIGSIRTIGINLTTYASFAHKYNPYFYGLGSVSLRLPGKISFTAQVQYDYKEGKFSFMKYTAEKYLFTRMFINASYQEFFTGNNEYFTGNYRNLLVGVRYDFSFARVNVSSLWGNNNSYNRVESASGSFIYDKSSDYFNINNRNNVGKAGMVIEPFLDINCNGVRDEGEPLAPGLKLRVNGGRLVQGKDSLIRVFDLEPYTSYFLELNPASFDNIAWQLKMRTIKVTVDANNFKRVQIPVYVVGEVSGMVMISREGKAPKGQGQIIVDIYDPNSKIVAHTVTESDGYFSYIGLAPGSYTARIAPEQLKTLNMTAHTIPFVIHSLKNNDGDIATGLEFVLKPKK